MVSYLRLRKFYQIVPFQKRQRIKRSEITRLPEQLSIEQVAKKFALKQQQNLTITTEATITTKNLFSKEKMNIFIEKNSIHSAKAWMPGKPLQEERLQWPGT